MIHPAYFAPDLLLEAVKLNADRDHGIYFIVVIRAVLQSLPQIPSTFLSIGSATSSDLARRECSMNASNHLPPPQGVSKYLHPSRRNSKADSKAGNLWPSRGASARWCHASWLTLPWLKREATQSTQIQHGGVLSWKMCPTNTDLNY